MARYLACIEIRPIPSGIWTFEEHRATFEGEVEITLYHPNPLVRVRPRRFRIPLVYTMHVPPFYTYRGPPPARPMRRFHSFRFRSATRSHPSSHRVVPDRTPSPDPTEYARTAPADYRPSGGVAAQSGEVEEDPEEGESEEEVHVEPTVSARGGPAGS